MGIGDGRRQGTATPVLKVVIMIAVPLRRHPRLQLPRRSHSPLFPECAVKNRPPSALCTFRRR